ncbi:uracil-DNA glycosylase [Desulfovibrio litoralis]|uniref:Uracil-DNA glycosylase n=1 Tax=Desulfovibrio litoralis DSM 11393 TaxID=1121455 RepID=A0A1M7T338_9BACT|nr:uracil-DNA glycosylase [Desulfovibrio litoralis]SHN65119.1 Uracil-DNA glycosylase [Desulfovibrio litoralis DSM 11393]
MTKSVKIADDWYKLLKDEFEKPYFLKLKEFVRNEYSTNKIFPSGKNIFRAFDLCPVDTLKVVIIGQDPYHGEGQANGLCFSVSDKTPLPPSLINIFKEVVACGYSQPKSGDLEPWAKQGVLMLNSVLTVRAHSAASHAGKGWELFTDAVIAKLNENKTGLVYMLWGAYAQKKASLVNASKNLILKAAHPSPLSAFRGFLGCKHFSEANSYLSQPINW